MQSVSVPFTMPHGAPAFAAATASHLGAAARKLHETPVRKSHAPVSPAHEAPTPSGVAHVLLVALQWRLARHGAEAPHAVPATAGATHFWVAHTRPSAQPSSTVQAPLAAARGAQTPQSPSVFSQCVLAHCQLDPQPSPFTRTPGLIWQEVGKTLATRSSQVEFAASRAHVSLSVVVWFVSGTSRSRVHPSVTRDSQVVMSP